MAASIKHPQWTDEQSADLIRLWREGYSGGQIAHTMNMTRNAIMGRLKRIGMFGVSTPRPKQPFAPCVKSVSTPRPKPAPIDTSPCKPVKLAKIGAHQCRWPLENYDARHGFPSCGRKTDSGPYCGEHARKAYQQHKREAA